MFNLKSIAILCASLNTEISNCGFLFSLMRMQTVGSSSYDQINVGTELTYAG